MVASVFQTRWIGDIDGGFAFVVGLLASPFFDCVRIISVALLSCEWHHAAFILPFRYQHARMLMIGFTWRRGFFRDD